MNPVINYKKFLYIIWNHSIGFIGEKNTSAYKNKSIKYIMVVFPDPILPMVSSWLDSIIFTASSGCWNDFIPVFETQSCLS